MSAAVRCTSPGCIGPHSNLGLDSEGAGDFGDHVAGTDRAVAAEVERLDSDRRRLGPQLPMR